MEKEGTQLTMHCYWLHCSTSHFYMLGVETNKCNKNWNNYINCTNILIQYCGFQMNGICVFICNVINDTVSNSHYTASNEYTTENLK